MSSGHFAGEQATEQAFAILSTATDYINDLDQYNMLLDRTMAFFDLAQSVNVSNFLIIYNGLISEIMFYNLMSIFKLD